MSVLDGFPLKHTEKGLPSLISMSIYASCVKILVCLKEGSVTPMFQDMLSMVIFFGTKTQKTNKGGNLIKGSWADVMRQMC